MNNVKRRLSMSLDSLVYSMVERPTKLNLRKCKDKQAMMSVALVPMSLFLSSAEETPPYYSVIGALNVSLIFFSAYGVPISSFSGEYYLVAL